jgi:hypothetical protein
MCFELFKIIRPEHVIVRFEDVTVATVNSMDFWVVILCSLEKAQYFEGTCCFLESDSTSTSRQQSHLSLTPASTGFFLTLQPR